MAPFLPGELKASGKEHLFQHFPVYESNSWHLQTPVLYTLAGKFVSVYPSREESLILWRRQVIPQQLFQAPDVVGQPSGHCRRLLFPLLAILPRFRKSDS